METKIIDTAHLMRCLTNTTKPRVIDEAECRKRQFSALQDRLFATIRTVSRFQIPKEPNNGNA